jgi:SHS2 domain-containing protein
LSAAQDRNKRYRFLEHMTDAVIEAYGTSLEEAFENAALALEDTMVDLNKIEPKFVETLSIEAKDKQELLYKWLEALIIKQDTEQMLYSQFVCKISRGKNENDEKQEKFLLEAELKGEKFDPQKFEQKTAVKAPTYHEMLIKEDPKNRRATVRFLLDL